jgi:predicted DNA-binding transcriptional regulator AlpA
MRKKEIQTMEVNTQRRLLAWGELLAILQLNDEQIHKLINTRQILELRIAGEQRFDSREIDQLIDCYRNTAKRRVQ